MSRRTERLGSAIRQQIMEAVQRDLNDPRLEGTLASVNRVKVSEDLSVADVYLVLMGTPGKQSAGLQAFKSAAGLLRGRLGKALATRTVPFLRFHLDEVYRKEVEVLNLIAKAESEFQPDDPSASQASAPQPTDDSGEPPEAPGA